MELKPLILLKDEDIFPKTSISGKVVYSPRLAVKAIVVDENKKIALTGTKYCLLPGGGVDEGEDNIEAIERECLEEIGCNIKVEKEIGFSEEYREKIGRHQKTVFFLAFVVGKKGKPTTKQVDESNLVTNWYDIEEALNILEKQVSEIPFEDYHACFNVRTHLIALREVRNRGLL